MLVGIVLSAAVPVPVPTTGNSIAKAAPGGESSATVYGTAFVSPYYPSYSTAVATSYYPIADPKTAVDWSPVYYR